MGNNGERMNNFKRKFISFIYRTKWKAKYLINKKKKNQESVKPEEDHSMDNSILPSSIFTKKNKKQPNFILSVVLMTIKLFILLFVILGIAGFGAFLGIGKAYLDGTPTLDFAEIELQNETSFIYDKDGHLVTQYYGLENRQWISYDDIPEVVIDAFVSIEDARFWVHDGLDYKRILGAVAHNATSDSVQGGSTITQQLLKNTLLTQEQSYKRKIQEMYLALQLEKTYSKDQIIEAYLNSIWLGGSNYGIKSAAQDYFNKELSELTLTEAATLAGITRNPWKYNPRRNVYTNQTPEITVKRTNLVLREMYENEHISLSEYEAALLDSENPLSNNFAVVETQTTNDYEMKYFIEYAVKDVRNALMEKYGWTGEQGRKEAEKLLFAGGLHIYTTLDTEIQRSTEEAVYNYDNLPGFKDPSSVISDDGVPQPQAAAVVIDNQTAELRAIVGGKQPPSVKKGFNRATDSRLELGSAIKPLAVYGPFIELGYPGGIIFEDVPATVEGWQGKDGRTYPYNYGGSNNFRGPVDVRTGIKKSINVVAARIVCERIGIDYSREKLIELGLNPNDVPQEPAALSLGTYGNNMIETAAAYTTIANHGTYREPLSFTKVVDRSGNVLISNEEQTTREVFSEETCYILIDWMKNVVKGGTVTLNLSNESKQSIPIAGKTGTVSDFKGAFFAGFSPYYTTTVWLGHDKKEPFKSGTTGGKYAAPLWKDIMEPLHTDAEPIDFYESKPENVVSAQVCPVSGLLATDACLTDINGLQPITELFPSKEAVPTETCTMHQLVSVCSATNKLASPYCPSYSVIQKSVIVVAPGSPYYELSDEDLQKYLPNAIRGVAQEGTDEILPMIPDYYDPAQQHLFCNLHTPDWNAHALSREQLAYSAVGVVNTAESNLVNPLYAPYLTAAEVQAIRQKIDELKYNIGYDFLTDPVNPHVAEFNENIAKTSMEELQALINSTFGRIQTELDNQSTILVPSN